MLDVLLPAYDWIKALHVIAVISWMAGMLYLPRLFVYHAERAQAGSELEQTFTIMESKLLRVIMNPAMIVAWVTGATMIALGGLDFGAVWSWAKIGAVVAMTGMHMWLAGRRREFAEGRNSLSGRIYRMANEVPTVLMIVIIMAVIARPF